MSVIFLRAFFGKVKDRLLKMDYSEVAKNLVLQYPNPEKSKSPDEKKKRNRTKNFRTGWVHREKKIGYTE
jgi:hypothetical protein